MEIEFKTHKLQAQFENHRKAEKAYGPQVARKYIQRVNLMKAARNFEELKRLPALRCHPLKGNRKGQWALNLTGFHRLIFTLQGEQLEIIRIEEVSKHYDD